MITEISITLGEKPTTFDFKLDAQDKSMQITVSQERREGKTNNSPSSQVKLTAYEAGAMTAAFSLLTDSRNT